MTERVILSRISRLKNSNIIKKISYNAAELFVCYKIMSLFKKIFGSNEREVSKLRPIVEKINSYEPEIAKLADEVNFLGNCRVRRCEQFRGTIQALRRFLLTFAGART